MLRIMLNEKCLTYMEKKKTVIFLPKSQKEDTKMWKHRFPQIES